MNIKEIIKDLPPIEEIVNYYGQDFDNIKHMKKYLNALIEKYIEDNYKCDSTIINQYYKGGYYERI